jgi:hypothetical protein
LNKRQQRELEELSALASGPPANPVEALGVEETTTTSRPPEATPSTFALVLRLLMDTIKLSDGDRQLAASNEGTEEDNEDDVDPKTSSIPKKKVIQ